MTEIMPLYERLAAINNVSDLMLAGSIRAYRPETARDPMTSVIHDNRMAA
jgi:hypothetical protein